MQITLADIYKQVSDIPSAVAVGDVLEITNVPYIVADAGPRTIALTSLVSGSRMGPAFTVQRQDQITFGELAAGHPPWVGLGDVTWLGPVRKVFGRIDQKKN